jgi:hypothetical protein
MTRLIFAACLAVVFVIVLLVVGVVVMFADLATSLIP